MKNRAGSSHLSKRMPYLPGLDGMRAIAVAAVLFYHAGMGWLPGGYLGVEVFFVISGYLITALLLTEWENNGRIDLPGFWLRRARRLLPAVGALLIAVLVISLLFLPDQIARLREDALAATFYVTNWHLIFSHQPYFETIGRPSLLQHLWSLAVEEQFYILWPPIFLVLVRLLPKRGAAATIALAALGSTLLMALLYRTGTDTSRLYYGTDTRASGLLAGAALAFLWAPWKASVYDGRRTASWIEAAGFGGLIALGVFFWRMGEASPLLYQGGFALVSLSTLLVITATVHPRARLLPKLLGGPVLTWLGTRSYGIYVWHYPIFMLTRPGIDIPIDGPLALVLRIGGTLAVAEISYRCIERPVRQGALDPVIRTLRRPWSVTHWRLRAASAAGSGAILLVVVSAASASTPPPPAYLQQPSFHGVVTQIVPPSVSAGGATGTPSGIGVVPTATPRPPTATPTIPAPPTPGAPSTVEPQPTATEPPPPPTPTSAATTAPTPAGPTATPPPPSTPTTADILAVGDSVMLGAANQLAQAGPVEVDAEEGRQASAFVSLLQARHAAVTIPSIVVLQLGNNGTVTQGQLDDIMAALEGVKRVVFVNLHVYRSWEDGDNALINGMAARYSNVRIVDWYSATDGHPELFYDGIHLRPEGAQLYGSLVAAAVTGP
ncbi:MAG: acyltransferase family protein [Tepidiformaceae bacterium]